MYNYKGPLLLGASTSRTKVQRRRGHINMTLIQESEHIRTITIPQVVLTKTSPCLQRLRHISTQENFPQKENFVKCDTQFTSEKNFEVENFQLLTRRFSVRRKFSSVEMSLYNSSWDNCYFELDPRTFLNHKSCINVDP
jgi:hypothetical protein